MVDNNKKRKRRRPGDPWWLYTYEFPARAQQIGEGLFDPQMERPQLVATVLNALAAQEPTVAVEDKLWSVSDVRKHGEHAIVFNLHRTANVRNLASYSGERLVGIKRPVFFSEVVLFTDTQRVAVKHQSTTTRSPSLLKRVLEALIDEGLRITKQDAYYSIVARLRTEPQAFLQWYAGLRKMDSITFRYYGKNLPSGVGDDFLDDIKHILDEAMTEVPSSQVDLTAHSPVLSESQRSDLDGLGNQGKLTFSAVGTSSQGKRVSFSADNPETALAAQIDPELTVAETIAKLREV